MPALKIKSNPNAAGLRRNSSENYLSLYWTSYLQPKGSKHLLNIWYPQYMRPCLRYNNMPDRCKIYYFFAFSTPLHCIWQFSALTLADTWLPEATNCSNGSLIWKHLNTWLPKATPAIHKRSRGCNQAWVFHLRVLGRNTRNKCTESSFNAEGAVFFQF